MINTDLRYEIINLLENQLPIGITRRSVNGNNNNNVDDKLKTANDVSNVLNFFGGFRLFCWNSFCVDY